MMSTWPTQLAVVGTITQAATSYCAWPSAQAAALGGDLGADGELTVPALLESEDPASVLVVRVRAACMLEHSARAYARTAFRALVCKYSLDHCAMARMHKRGMPTVTRFTLPRLML